MEQKEIIEGDALIEASPFKSDTPKFIRDLSRETNTYYNWKMIMPVMESIEAFNNYEYGFTIDPWGIEVIEYSSGNEKVVSKVERYSDESRLELLYTAILQFIQFYNALNK